MIILYHPFHSISKLLCLLDDDETTRGFIWITWLWSAYHLSFLTRHRSIQM